MEGYCAYVDILDLIDEVEKASVQEYSAILELASSFNEEVKKELLKLPYHLNLIDELHINENGHSRLLFKLLQYRDENGEYIFLKSLIGRLSGINRSYETIKIEDPKISREIERIDLWVRDKSYAIIFENKVYNAKDQEAQLSRYIDKTLGGRVNPQPIEKIFVVYMPHRPSEPSDQSWGVYKETMEARYVCFSFFSGVLPWLEENILPNVVGKDRYLSSAIYQYVDYLKGLFCRRDIQKPMNMNLEKFVSQQLSLDECRGDKERYSLLKEKYEDCRRLSDELWKMQSEALKRYWRSETLSRYPDLKLDGDSQYIGVKFDVSGSEICVHIDKEYSKFYCQAEFSDKRPIEGTFLPKLKGEILKKSNDWCVWTNFDSEPSEELFRCFLEAIRWLLDWHDTPREGRN